MKPKKLPYWTEETQGVALMAYNDSQTAPDAREKIYEEILYPALNKLVENIFNTFKMSYFDVGFEEMQKQTVSHLTEKLHMFNPTSGFKSFSYFSIITKNFLIQESNRNYKKWKISEPVIFETDNGSTEPHRDLMKDAKIEYETSVLQFIELLRDYWYAVSKVYGIYFDYIIMNRCIRNYKPSEALYDTDDNNQRFTIVKLKKAIKINCSSNLHTFTAHINAKSKELYKYYLDNNCLPEPDKKINRMTKKREINLINKFEQNFAEMKQSADAYDTASGERIKMAGMAEMVIDIRNKKIKPHNTISS